jgi:hypothetical protein
MFAVLRRAWRSLRRLGGAEALGEGHNGSVIVTKGMR